MFNPIVSSTMKSDLMTAEHICTVLTPWRGKTSPTKCPPLCCEKASALGHHKRAVTPICAPSASLAGKVYFQILATDSYVSNKNKPFLPGMLRLNHLSASIYSRPRALQLKSYLLNVLVEIMCQMVTKRLPFLTGFPPLGSRKFMGLYSSVAGVLHLCFAFVCASHKMYLY